MTPDPNAQASLAEAVGVRERDDAGRALYTFTLSSAPVGMQVPQTWRLAVHAHEEAAEWVAALQQAALHVETEARPARK